MAVDARGPTPSAVEWLSNKVEDAGYNGVNITMNSDQEESIEVLNKAVSIERKSATALVDIPVRASKSNSTIERAVRTLRSQFRILRCQHKDRIHSKFPKVSPLMSWLTKSPSDVPNR